LYTSSNLQDVLVVTAPGSGAEIIPFLKTWVNLPMAIGFTVLYAKVGKHAWFELQVLVIGGCV
jgi:ATP/ADP translocase